MGMDVYGKNPKENKKKSDFPMLVKVDKLEKKEEWKERRELIDTQSDNCWWWRPLWNFCYNVAPELISDDLWANGHHNSGAGLNGEDAKLLGEKLFKAISNGFAEEFKEHHEEQEESEEYKYPFDTENVKAFAEFCIESGGFEIC